MRENIMSAATSQEIAEANRRRYEELRAAGQGATLNTHVNCLAAAAKIGLGLRDIPPCATFFAPVSVDPNGRLVWNGARKQAGDFVDLRAEMNLVLAVSNCAHPLDPARPAATGQ